MQVLISLPDVGGLPRTEVVADLESVLTPDGCAATRAAFWGDLQATVRYTGTLDDAFIAAQDWLGAGVQIVAPDSTVVWSGLVWSVAFGAGGRRRTRSLDGYANRARLVYDEISAATAPPTVTTAGQVIVTDDLAGQARYGLIEYTSKPGQLVLAQATARNARDLTDRSRLLYTPEGGTLGELGSSEVITLTCMGWWRTLMYQVYTAATTGTADVAVIIKAILTASCPFVSADQSQIQTTGIVAAQQFSAYEPAGTIIKQLVASVDGWTFGIGPDRIAYLRPNGQGAASATYIEQADGRVEDASGGSVPLWSIVPDTLLRQADVAPALTDLLAIKTIETVYLSEVTFTAPSRLAYKASVAGVDGALSAV